MKGLSGTERLFTTGYIVQLGLAGKRYVYSKTEVLIIARMAKGLFSMASIIHCT